MDDNDPFFDLLQGALEMPDDLSLGSEARARLLAAGGTAGSSESGKVVVFPVASSAEREGFEWLAGERHAGSELLEKMMASPALLATLEGDRIFLGHLRRVMRRPKVAAAALTSGSGGWRRPVYTMASMAALLLISAVPVWRSVAHRATPSQVAAAVENDGARPAPADPAMGSGFASIGRRDGEKRISSGTAERGTEIVGSRMPPSVVAGGGCSFAANDPDWTEFHAVKATAPGGDVRMLASELLSAPENSPQGGATALAGNFPTDSDHALAANEVRDRSAGGYFPGMNADFRLDNGAFFSPGGSGGDLSIPEPSGGVPVMVGFMVLLLHRFRRRFPKAHQPIRP